MGIFSHTPKCIHYGENSSLPFYFEKMFLFSFLYCSISLAQSELPLTDGTVKDVIESEKLQSQPIITIQNAFVFDPNGSLDKNPLSIENTEADHSSTKIYIISASFITQEDLMDVEYVVIENENPELKLLNNSIDKQQIQKKVESSRVNTPLKTNNITFIPKESKKFIGICNAKNVAVICNNSLFNFLAIPFNSMELPRKPFSEKSSIYLNVDLLSNVPLKSKERAPPYFI